MVSSPLRCDHDRDLLIEGARQNNLKNLSLRIPHNQVTAITGVSGSGKSSLAFDTVFAEGQWRYGLCLGSGEGVAQDMTLAVQWVRKAAEQNYANAQSTLGFCYENGRGVGKDLQEAINWYRKAAAQGNTSAKEALQRLE